MRRSVDWIIFTIHSGGKKKRKKSRERISGFESITSTLLLTATIITGVLAWSGSLVFSLLHPSTFPYFPFFPHSPSSLHYTFNSPQLENAIILPSPPPPCVITILHSRPRSNKGPKERLNGARFSAASFEGRGKERMLGKIRFAFTPCSVFGERNTALSLSLRLSTVVSLPPGRSRDGSFARMRINFVNLIPGLATFKLTEFQAGLNYPLSSLSLVLLSSPPPAPLPVPAYV